MIVNPLRFFSRAVFARSLLRRCGARRSADDSAVISVSISDFNRLLNQPTLEPIECRAILKKAVSQGLQPDVITFQLLARHGTFPWSVLRGLLYDFGVKVNVVIASYAIEAAERAADVDEIITDLEAAGIYNFEDDFMWKNGAMSRGFMRFMERQRAARPSILAETGGTGALPWPPRVFIAVGRAAIAEGLLDHFLDLAVPLTVMQPSPPPLAAEYATLAVAVCEAHPTSQEFDFNVDPLVLLAEHASIYNVPVWREPRFVEAFVMRAKREGESIVKLAKYVMSRTEDAALTPAVWGPLLEGVMAVLERCPENEDVALLAEAIAMRLDGPVWSERSSVPFVDRDLLQRLHRSLSAEAGGADQEVKLLRKYTSAGPSNGIVQLSAFGGEGAGAFGDADSAALRDPMQAGFSAARALRAAVDADAGQGADGAEGEKAASGGAEAKAQTPRGKPSATSKAKGVVDRPMPVMDSVGLPPFLRRGNTITDLPVSGGFAYELRSSRQ